MISKNDARKFAGTKIILIFAIPKRNGSLAQLVQSVCAEGRGFDSLSSHHRKGKSSLIMLFNSIDFAIFLPVVTILYWTVFTKGGGKITQCIPFNM